MYVCMSVCLYVCMYVCMYVRMYDVYNICRLRIDYGDGRVIRGSSTKMVISQLWNVIFRDAIHH